jgi:CRISPR-associated protein Cas2
MALTLIVTRDVAPRFRGFLASAMQELAPGVYVNPRMSPGVRDRIWEVLTSWFEGVGGGSIVMAFENSREEGGVSVMSLGLPPRTLENVTGMLLVRREV